MSSHLLAWFESVSAAALTDIQPVTDNIMTIQNNHFFPQDDWFLLWAFVANDVNGTDQARLVTPMYRQFSPPQLLPGSDLLPAATTIAPQPSDYNDSPLKIPKLEELELQVAPDNAAAGSVYGAALVTRGRRSAPVGDVYSMFGTSTTAATADQWSTVTVTWADTLPNGLYSVIGLRYYGTATGFAARLIFEDQIPRPGCLCSNAQVQPIPAVSRRGHSGEFGRFNQNRMPIVEVLDTAAGTTHDFLLDFVRVG